MKNAEAIAFESAGSTRSGDIESGDIESTNNLTSIGSLPSEGVWDVVFVPVDPFYDKSESAQSLTYPDIAAPFGNYPSENSLTYSASTLDSKRILRFSSEELSIPFLSEASGQNVRSHPLSEACSSSPQLHRKRVISLDDFIEPPDAPSYSVSSVLPGGRALEETQATGHRTMPHPDLEHTDVQQMPPSRKSEVDSSTRLCRNIRLLMCSCEADQQEELETGLCGGRILRPVSEEIIGRRLKR